jgi:type IV secretion system protein VirB3
MNDQDYFDPIYKGCTSPSTVFGIPMLPFILGGLVFAQAAALGFYFFGLWMVFTVAVLAAGAFIWAKKVSRNDDQRLLQVIMRMRMRGPQGASKRHWGAVSYSPFRTLR